MNFKERVSLRPFNTFGIEASARHFIEVKTVDELQEVIKSDLFRQQDKILIIGGGSNILLTGDFEGLVVKNSIKGIAVIQQTEDYVLVKSGAGEVWHDLVLYAISKGYGGIENLSLIPGTVGAAPMQNIGAYGVEIKEVFEYLEAVEIETGEIIFFNNKDCCFGYRESIFKKAAKGKFIITTVVLKLTKRNHLKNIGYGAIQQVLAEEKITDPDLRQISDAVISIRQSKLPDPKKIGNAGSFFKNPVVTSSEFEKLQRQFPDLPHYPQHDGMKLPAGWLIEQCGWKGKRRGNIGVHDLQALVLVNLGGGTGAQLKELADDIQQSVKEKFDIILEPEVNFIY